jgi:hypothetical protein
LPSSLPSAQPRVLVAGSRLAIDTFTRLLGDRVRFVFAESFEEALAHLDDGLDLVVCTARFDESRMFDLLEALRERQEHPLPVICCRVMNARLRPPMYRSIELASNALGAAAFFDLHTESMCLGVEVAEQQLRELVLGWATPAARAGTAPAQKPA